MRKKALPLQNVPFPVNPSLQIQMILVYFDTFYPNVPFLHPLKKSENQRFSDIFRGYRNGTLGENVLKE